jgi:hypothetical protein
VCGDVGRLSITVEPEIGKALRDAAVECGVSVWKWVGEAIRRLSRWSWKFEVAVPGPDLPCGRYRVIRQEHHER